MRRLFFAVLISVIALWIAQDRVPGFEIVGDPSVYLVAGGTLGLMHVVVKPMLKILAFPLVLLSLGLFGLLVNALLLWALTSIVPSVTIAGIVPLVWGTVIISAGNVVADWVA